MVIFASGEGSNAERIMEHFAPGTMARITWVVSNREEPSVFLLHFSSIPGKQKKISGGYWTAL